MFVLFGQAALIQCRQLDMVWEQLVRLGYQQMKCLDGLCLCLVLVLSLNSEFMLSNSWLLAWLTFPWHGLCLDGGDVLSCLHDTHSFQEEALIPESVGPGFLLCALGSFILAMRTQSSRSPSSSLAAMFSCYQDF